MALLGNNRKNTSLASPSRLEEANHAHESHVHNGHSCVMGSLHHASRQLPDILTIREMDRVPSWPEIATSQATPNSSTPRPPRSDNFALICLQLYLFICRTDQEKLLGARNLYHVSSSSIYTHAGSRSDF